jgi:hypothetical protein
LGSKVKRTRNHVYRKIWIDANGPIPKDEDGRSYELHHIDNNPDNNDISNLVCITIKEHYDIHYEQGDYGACVMIAKRMGLPPDYRSNIQKGVKRPGVGGRPKGCEGWNKGMKGVYKAPLSPEGRIRHRAAAESNAKFKIDDAEYIRRIYEERPFIDDNRIGKVQRNGIIFPYKRAFAEYYSNIYGVHRNYIIMILDNKVKRPIYEA